MDAMWVDHRRFSNARSGSFRVPRFVFCCSTSSMIGSIVSSKGCLSLLLLVTLFTTCRAADHEKPDAIDVLLFMFFGIGVGVLFMQFLNKIGDPVPYTVVVFIAGILFSLANKDGTGVFGQSIEIWINIDPELLLFVFLPPLIFGEAMGLNWYQAKGALSQATILAGPGVLVGAVIMGGFVKAMLPKWSWYLCMTFGAITSATDPVAVVALLKSAGASPKLTMIIVGESLLNDGTAMVLFTVFYNLLCGKTYTGGSIIAFFLAACFGSVIVGVIIGLITVRWMRTAKRPLSDMDVLVQTAITICSAYVTFFVAQKTLMISGVLACCGSGIMLAWLAPPIVLNHETMHNVWGMMEWMLNTMIFLLAGLIIGNRIFDYVRPLDWLFLIVLYILLMLIRFLVIYLCFPFISKIGHKCTWEEAIFMGWGGLRGALGMTLALIVYRDGPQDMQGQTSAMFFYIGGIAAITLVVNATTANALLVKLKLLGNDSAEKAIVLVSIQKKLRKGMRKALQELATEFHFNEKELDEVRQSVSILSETNMEELMAAVAAQKVQQDQKVQRKNSIRIERPDRALETATNPLLAAAGGAAGSAPTSGPTSSESSAVDIQHVPSFARRFSFDRSKASTNNSDHGPPPMYGVIPENEETNGADDDKFDVIEMLEAGHNSRYHPRSRGSSNADTMHRRLSMSGRGPMTMITPQLLAYVRSTFLSMVRVHYWHDIEQGKLPRKSKSGKFLLYSVEVALDEVTQEAGARDWACVEGKLDSVPHEIQALTYLEEKAPEGWFTFGSIYLNKLECTREERTVYILTSFIAAHENAQAKIHGYLRVDEGDDESAHDHQSPEELKVIAESKLAVTIARRRLENINPETVTAIRTKQAAALILTKQADAVKQMVQEGLLTTKDAEEIIEDINKDMAGIEQKRNRMYREHGDSSSRRRKALRKLQDIPTNGLLANADI